jgi:hypothetical protein
MCTNPCMGGRNSSSGEHPHSRPIRHHFGDFTDCDKCAFALLMPQQNPCHRVESMCHEKRDSACVQPIESSRGCGSEAMRDVMMQAPNPAAEWRHQSAPAWERPPPPAFANNRRLGHQRASAIAGRAPDGQEARRGSAVGPQHRVIPARTFVRRIWPLGAWCRRPTSLAETAKG